MTDLDSQTRMPLWQHLDDLRKVIVRCLLALSAGVVVGYLFCDPLIAFLERPLLKLLPPEDAHLYYLGVAEKFMVYFKVSLIAGVILVCPFLLYQLWWFVSPALYRHERKFLVPFLGFGSLTFLLGMAFCFWAIIPAAYHFMLGIGPSAGLARIRLNQYFTLTLKMMFMTGCLFELPVVLVLLGRMGLIDSSTLSKYRKHALLGLLIVSAFISPTPDAFSMVIVWAPLWLLYELSVFLVGWASRQAA